MDCLQDILREGGYIDMGIPTNATVEDSRSHRRRNYCVQILNRVEMEIENYKENWSQGEDISLWKNEKGKYKKVFSTRETWLSIKEKHQLCSWHQAVWFKHATPKFSFMT